MSEQLDQAFEKLQNYDFGDDRKALNPIDEAIVDSQHDDQVRGELEQRLIAVLQSDATRNAKDFVCRKLKVMGTEKSIPALAKMLGNKDHSHMARYALQEMRSDAATQALLESIDRISDELKVGVIGTLGARGDNAAVARLGSLLDQEGAVGESAARALGAIRTGEAAKALSENKSMATACVLDSMLACAEAILSEGDKPGALKVYRKVATTPDLPKHVKLAATRGMLACAATG